MKIAGHEFELVTSKYPEARASRFHAILGQNPEETMAKGAQEFVEALVRAVRPLKTTAIVLREDEPRPGYDFNWIIAAGPMPPEATTRYQTAISEMKSEKENARLDWEGVMEREGEWRIVQRWVSDE